MLMAMPGLGFDLEQDHPRFVVLGDAFDALVAIRGAEDSFVNIKRARLRIRTHWSVGKNNS